MILGGGQQAGDVSDAFGNALPEEQLGAQSQVLWMFDEAETDDGSLTCTQLVLSVEALHGGCLPDIANMYSDLRPPTEGLGVEEQDDGSFKLTADGGVHLGTDHHHALTSHTHC